MLGLILFPIWPFRHCYKTEKICRIVDGIYYIDLQLTHTLYTCPKMFFRKAVYNVSTSRHNVDWIRHYFIYRNNWIC